MILKASFSGDSTLQVPRNGKSCILGVGGGGGELFIDPLIYIISTLRTLLKEGLEEEAG